MPAPKRRKKEEAPPPPDRLTWLKKVRPLEVAAIGLLLFAVLLYGINRCNTPSAADSNEQAGLGAVQDSSLAALPDSLQQAVKGLTKVYVVMDSVKLRSKPGLDGKIIRVLMHDEAVYDLGEQTKMMENIQFSVEERRTEPWVKVRTAEGQEGWVFGAVVSFYRKRKPAPRTVGDSTTTTVSDSTIMQPQTANPTATPSAPAPTQLPSTAAGTTPVPPRPSRPNTN